MNLAYPFGLRPGAECRYINMNMKRVFKAIIIAAAILAFAGAEAKTVRWSIPPAYEKLSRHHSDLFLHERNGKWGMIRVDGKEVLPAQYDFITDFVNGYALAGVKDGASYQLQHIISPSGEVVDLKERYYVALSAPNFSEGKLAVVNREGKYGYIGPMGQVIVRCQFDGALAFNQGWAPVKQGSYFKYISEDFDRNPSKNVMAVDFHYGDMTFAGCFCNGKAPVAYNKDYALIDLSGRKVKSISKDEFNNTCVNNSNAPKDADGFTLSNNYKEFSQGSLCGLKQGDQVVAIPQFGAIGTQYADDYIIASQKGKQGLLRVENGNYAIDLMPSSGPGSELEVDRKDNIEKVELRLSMPSQARDLKLMVDAGDGNIVDAASLLQLSGNAGALLIAPVVAENAETCNISVSLESDGIIVAQGDKKFDIIYPIKLTVAKPAAVSAKADENDNVTIYSNVYNGSNKPVTVTVTLTAKQSVSNTYTIQPHSSVRISLTEKITSAQTVNTSVSLSTGERAADSLYLEPFN